jgi:TonB-dependent receptor
MANGKDVNLRLGVRYEETKITSQAVASIPTGTIWVAQNEINLVSAPGTGVSTLKGKYENLLPAIDLDLSPIDNVKLRASYSHTITRPDYASMQGGITVGQPLRVGAGGSTASSGNPALDPYKSKNFDVSAEWYYAKSSYVSLGYFDKRVSNFIANGTTQVPLYDLNDPSQGAAAIAARAALGANASFDQIVAWVKVNRPDDYVAGVGTAGGIIGRAADPDVVFTYTQPSNSDEKARLNGWEFAVQHNFWETGFGGIFNYTIVESDTSFDNTLPWTTTQFAVTGASNSANAVLFYDKNGLQARVAYNWRDKFLAGKDQDPYYIKAYGQIDVSASYEFYKGMTVFAEGINITNEDRTGVRRNNRAVFFAAPGYSRFSTGVRFTF